MWEPQHALADEGWRIVMPQFRGFDCTKSDVPAAASLEDYARDVADLLETLAVGQAMSRSNCTATCRTCSARSCLPTPAPTRIPLRGVPIALA